MPVQQPKEPVPDAAPTPAALEQAAVLAPASALEQAAVLAYLWTQTRSFSGLGLVPLIDLANTADVPNAQQSVELLDANGSAKPFPFPRSSPDKSDLVPPSEQDEAVDAVVSPPPTEVGAKPPRVGVCLRAKRDLWAGEEISYSYGQHAVSARDFFLQYGFALEGSSHKSDVGSGGSRDDRVREEAVCAGLREWAASVGVGVAAEEEKAVVLVVPAEEDGAAVPAGGGAGATTVGGKVCAGLITKQTDLKKMISVPQFFQSVVDFVGGEDGCGEL